MLWNSFENRKRTFSGRKINHQSYGPEKNDDFFGKIFQFPLSGRSPTENGAPFSINIRDRNWRLDSGFHTSWEATSVLRYAESSSSTKAASICQASNKTCAACCALIPTPARLRHHEPLGRGCCDCVDDESSCDVAQPHFWPRRGRGG